MRDSLQSSSTDAVTNSRAPGAESSGELEGCVWRVFSIRENGRVGHVLVTTCAPRVRKKMRIPKKYTTVDQRARFARGAAPQVRKEWLAERAEVERETRDPAPDPAAITFNEFASLWTSGKLAALYPGNVKENRSIEGDIQRLAFMKPLIGDVALRDFRVEHAEKVIVALPKARSSSTLRHYGQTLHRGLALAVYPGKILERHPLPDGFLPSVAPRRAMSFVYPVEDAALMACLDVPSQRRVLYGFLAREGMRYGEAVGLRWSDWDLDRGVIVLDRTKTNEPRSWKLGEDVLRALATLRKHHPEPKSGGRVFLDEIGAPFVGKKVANTFRADLVRAGS